MKNHERILEEVLNLCDQKAASYAEAATTSKSEEMRSYCEGRSHEARDIARAIRALMKEKA